MFKPFYTQLPTIKTHDGNTVVYDINHIYNFFNHTVYDNTMSLSIEEKEIWFNMHKENDDLINKICSTEAIKNVMGQQVSLHESAQSDNEEIGDNSLLLEYKEWLQKQE